MDRASRRRDARKANKRHTTNQYAHALRENTIEQIAKVIFEDDAHWSGSMLSAKALARKCVDSFAKPA